MEKFVQYCLGIWLLAEFSSFVCPEPVPSNDGRWYNAEEYGNNGKYVPGDEGKYIHMRNPYNHIDNPFVHRKETIRRWFVPGHYENNGNKIIKQVHHYGKDKYDFVYETENKIRAEEKASVVATPNTKGGTTSSGSVEYIAPDGYLYRTVYTAGVGGYRAVVTRHETEFSGKFHSNRIHW